MEPSRRGPRPDMWWKVMTAAGVLMLVYAILSL